jgi:hypothetical protein
MAMFNSKLLVYQRVISLPLPDSCKKYNQLVSGITGGFEHEHHKYVDAKKKDMYSSNVVFSGQYVDHLGLLEISIL